MAGISPIGSVPPPIGPSGAGAADRQASADKADGFGKMLHKYVDSVDHEQQEVTSAVQDLLAGKSQDVLPVITAMAKADMSFKLLMGVRNKVIEAYKQTMNMQI